MAQLNTGQYNFNTLDTATVPNIGEFYLQVGQQLNKQYYQNRSLYTQGVSNPLAQMKARKADQGTLNDIKASINEGVDQFLENDDWSQATNFVFDATDRLVSNTGLVAIQESFNQEQSYKQGLKDSGWDAQNQTAFLIQSQLQSSAIEYDSELNQVTGGGFAGVDYGNPYDLDKLNKDIADVLSKVPASGIESQRVLTDPGSAVVRGIATITGIDGQEVASHFTQMRNSTEGVTPERISNYVYSRLQNNPEYKNYLKTINRNNWILNRWQSDPDNPQGGSLRDFTNEDLINAGIFQGNTLVNALAGYGINLSDLGAIKKDGSFILNKNLSQDTQEQIDIINNSYGIDLVSILGNPNNRSFTQEQITAIESFKNSGINLEIDNFKENYVNQFAQNGEQEVDLNNFYQQILDNHYINRSIGEQVQSYTGLFSWQKSSSLESLVENKFATEAYKNKAKEIQDFISGRIQPIQLETIQGVMPDINSTIGFIENQNEYGRQLKTIENQLSGIVFTEEDYRQLGISPGDTYSLRNLPVHNLNNSSNIDPELLNKVGTYQALNTQMNEVRGFIQGNEQVVDRVFELWQQNRDEYTGYGYYGVAAETAKFILDNNIRSAEEYNRIMDSEVTYVAGNPEVIRDPTGAIRRTGILPGRVDPRISDENFNKVVANAVDNIYNRYNRNLSENETNQFAAVQFAVRNPSQESQMVVNNAKNALRMGVGDWVIKSTPSGKGIGEPATQYADLLTIDTRPENVTFGKNGETITTKNLPASTAAGIKGKTLNGKADEVHYTEYALVQDPNSLARNRGSVQVLVSQYGKNGEFIGNVILERESTPQEAGRLIQSNYNKLADSQQMFGALDTTIPLSASKLISSANESMYSFLSRSDNAELSATNLADLEQKLTGLQPGESRTLNLQVQSLVSGADAFHKNVRITRTSNPANGQLGYNVQLIDVNPTFNINGIGSYISPYIQPGNNFVGNSIGESFTDLTNWLLYSGYIAPKIGGLNQR